MRILIIAVVILAGFLCSNIFGADREVYRSRSGTYQGSSYTQKRTGGNTVTTYRDKSNSTIGTSYTSGNRTVYKDRSNVTIGSSSANNFNPKNAANRVYGLPTKK